MDFRDFITPLTLVISIFLGGRFKWNVLSVKVTNTIRHTAFIVFVIIEKLPCTRCLKFLWMIAIHRRLIRDRQLRLFNHDGGNLFTVGWMKA